ncbi:MAG TPA: GMC family oxidoreductase [Ktedonobacteraceae bacterium]|nr:GMC family oxidoreductase [Ktedonobacteraceae bacterium]
MSANSRKDAQRRHIADYFDVCIVGSGASGSFVADTLVQAGWNVLMIEQGERVQPGTNLDDYTPHYERAYARDQEGKWTLKGYPWSACALGGGTNFYAGVSFRLRLLDFDASAFVAPDALDVRWPIGYDDLAEYYDEVEQRLGVSRTIGLDPTEPPHTRPAALPPHAYSRRGSLLANAAEHLGLKPFPTPLAINSIPYNNFPACENLTCCTDYACPIQAKADMASRIILPLTKQPNFTLCTKVKAVRFLQQKSDTIDGLECLDLLNQRRFTIRARIFVLAANAVQSAALVLRSTTKWWPDGVGNAGLVGRGLCFKLSEYVAGWAVASTASALDDAREQNLQGLYSTMSLTDYYQDADCPAQLGGLIYEANPWEPIPQSPEVLLRMECILADQPMWHNQVRLSNIQDEYGLPRLILNYHTHPLDASRLAYMTGKARGILQEAHAHDIEHELSYYTLGSTHLHGTCRAGVDEKTSVVNRYGRFHTLENLYAVDGSFMPYPGSVNPTLTIQANALRIARHLAQHARP